MAPSVSRDELRARLRQRIVSLSGARTDYTSSEYARVLAAKRMNFSQVQLLTRADATDRGSELLPPAHAILKK